MGVVVETLSGYIYLLSIKRWNAICFPNTYQGGNSQKHAPYKLVAS